MTIQDAINYFKESMAIGKDDDSRHHNEVLEFTIKALEQEPIIDKLRDEIMDTGAYEQEVNGNTEFLKGINYCLGVIDKYKAETEREE